MLSQPWWAGLCLSTDRDAGRQACPDFRLNITADTLAVFRGGQAKMKVAVERLGDFVGPIDLTIDGLPSDVTAGKRP